MKVSRSSIFDDRPGIFARYLRSPEAREMVGFAEVLFSETDGRIPVGGARFGALWSEVATWLVSASGRGYLLACT